MSMNEPELQSLAEKVGPALAEFFDSKSDSYYCALVFTDDSGHVRSFLVTEETASSPILVPSMKTEKKAGKTLYGLDIPAVDGGTRFLANYVFEDKQEAQDAADEIPVESDETPAKVVRVRLIKRVG